MVTSKHWLPLEKPRVTLAGPVSLSDTEREYVAMHEEAVQRLHPDLKAAYDAWQRSGHEGSLYDYLPGNYRELMK